MKKRFIYYHLPAVLYMVLLFIISVRPMPEELPEFWQMDKFLHLGAYIVLGAVVVRALAGGGDAPTFRAVRSAFIISVGYGLLIEICQLFIPYRSFDLIDLVADAAGGLIGAVAYKGLSSGVMESEEQNRHGGI